ncbi:hypothetical protein KI387_024588, partial [Taxus chinensis]
LRDVPESEITGGRSHSRWVGYREEARASTETSRGTGRGWWRELRHPGSGDGFLLLDIDTGL